MAINHLGANSRGGDMTLQQKDKYLHFNQTVDLILDATQRKMNLYVGISSGNTLVLGAEDFTEDATGILPVNREQRSSTCLLKLHLGHRS